MMCASAFVQEEMWSGKMLRFLIKSCFPISSFRLKLFMNTVELFMRGYAL